MPTGYTAALHDGTQVDFRTFVLTCSRGLMATVHQRDEPLSKLPTPRTVSEYARSYVENCKTNLANLERVTPEQADVRAATEYQEQLDHYEQVRINDAQLRTRYESTLIQVRAWIPPTKDHQPLKDFMIEQLEDSIKHDCELLTYTAKAERKTGQQWLAEQLESARYSLASAEKRLAEEELAVASANAWITALYESLDSHE